MKTSLDIFDDILLERTGYDGKSLCIDLNCLNYEGCLKAKAKVIFDKPFIYLVAEELLESCWGFPSDEGFIKVFGAEDGISKALNISFFPTYGEARHYRLYTRDEVIHVFSRCEPRIAIVDCLDGVP